MSENSNIKIFPYYMLRICSKSVDEFQKLNLYKTNNFINRTLELNKKIESLKKEIVDNLFVIIPKIDDKVIRNVLLKCKREIYNKKLLSNDVFMLISPSLSEGLKIKLNQYDQLINHYIQLEKGAHNYYDLRISKLRNTLVKLAINDTFRKGVLLSSVQFYKFLREYLRNPNESDFEKIELTLIKYLSRLYMKTSPFSTFTNIAIEKLSLKDSTINSISHIARSHIRLSNYNFRYLKNLLIKNSLISKNISIQLNKTIKREENEYAFVANDQNREAIQRIEATVALDYFFNLFSHNKKLTLTNIAEIVKSSQANTISLTEIEKYITQLIEYGFLEYDWEISGLDPEWSQKLQAKLIPFKNSPVILNFIKTLKKIDQLVKLYENASLSKRETLLNKIFRLFRDGCKRLHQEANLPKEELQTFEDNTKFKNKKKGKNKSSLNTDIVFKQKIDTGFYFEPHQLIYEDTSINLNFDLSNNQVEDLLSKLHKLLISFRSFSIVPDDQEKMLSYFIEKYGEDGKIELSKFYEDYSRECILPLRNKKLSQKEKSEINKKYFVIDPDTKKRIKNNKKYLKQAVATLKKEKQNFSDEIRLYKHHLPRILSEDHLYNNKMSLLSLSSYLQLYQTYKKEINVVVNGYSYGNGKMYGRFLYMFDSSITRLIQGWNQPKDKDIIFAENTDASSFNANMHPPLMPYEIQTPSSQNIYQIDFQVPLTDLFVGIDNNYNRLQLYHNKSHKRLFVFDLGFQEHKGRSELFNFLNSFSINQKINIYPLIKKITSVNNKKKSSPHVYPRITYDDQIVFQRKAWIFAKKLLPLQKDNESDSEYFFRINRWKIENNLPEEIFIHIARDESKGTYSKKNKYRLSNDDYKPQYIAFENPYLIRLFSKLVKKISKTLYIEEMLPNTSQLLKFHSQKFMMEFVFQWYY